MNPHMQQQQQRGRCLGVGGYSCAWHGRCVAALCHMQALQFSCSHCCRGSKGQLRLLSLHPVG
jgi:hypothetical protein